ncbi:type II secretion system protein GspL [Pseudidiomarina aestuarii]|uniref:Type II secretion system protein L n=1 Tax=Pseudidiomarina aestuarii TaxID=624146 RepID=A0A2T4CNV9_9GAMM|nr:type II secretion system protein GspL [Pseudidiomarina aestuarii]PTB85144.1 type II secretion system protein GspL [Pseudidiomarina aestuarii]PTB89276.1 type II secretion system protein GspL [Pseudidiomarina aestuarii]PTB89533.1 type II secretion system protein GspL [Pseudidiomarina aestuarii]
METLYIRLPASAEQPVHWLIWNSTTSELIASGTVPQASDLAQLTERARSRDVAVFVAGQAVSMKHAPLPAGSQRLWAQLVPNTLEDEFATDIDKLHFAWPTNFKVAGAETPLPVAVVSDAAMQNWLEWLQAADIEADQLFPDFYMLPAPPANTAHALQLGNDVIIRNGEQSGFAVEADLLDSLGLETFVDADCTKMVHFGPVQVTSDKLEAADIEVPLSIVANANSAAHKHTINLRQNDYKVTRKRRKVSTHLQWRPVATAATVLIALVYVQQVATYIQLGQQQEQVRVAIEQTYRDVVPGEGQIVNAEVQLRRQLEAVAGTAAVSGNVMQVLTDLQPAFQAAGDMQLELLRFERGELRLQARAERFNSFEAFRTAAQQAGGYDVEQGSISNNDSGVSGTLTVRVR